MKKEKQSREMTDKLLIAAIVVGLIAIATSSYAILNPRVVYRNVTICTGTCPVNITGSLYQPPTSFSDSPVVTQNQSFGSRLTDINEPLNSTELGIINNAPSSYYEKAGEMALNGMLTNRIGGGASKTPPFLLNGKPIVLYFGEITCVFCGENRWAMAMALSRFGNFSYLFKGYSAIEDADLPTLFWAPAHYKNSTTVLGDFYSSKYISFIAIEDQNPITGGFAINPPSMIQQIVNATGNQPYIQAFQYIVNAKQYGGSPLTVWGSYLVGGADATVVGNNSTPLSNGHYQLEDMTHAQVLKQLATPNNQFAWSEYAAADYYVALICKTLNNTASVCSLPAIGKLEAGL